MGLDADIGASGVLRNPRTFKGAGQVIAVNDTGFDTGSNDDTPPAFTGRILTMKNAHDPSLSVADTVYTGLLWRDVSLPAEYAMRLAEMSVG